MKKRFDVRTLFVGLSTSIREVMACIERNAKGIALVVNSEQKLLGTITDGDVRRAILGGLDLDRPASDLLASKANSFYARPVTARDGASRSELLELVQHYCVRQIPLLDKNEKVTGLVTISELLPQELLPIQAVIMAGGAGTRLRPLTDRTPKPMLPVGDRPLMQVIIEQLRQAGIRKVNITTHYHSQKIRDYFGDGTRFGIEIDYVNEDRPLGTAGALGLLEAGDDPLLVINGDILTRMNFRAMLDFHREHGADLTVAVRKYELKVPYGVVECDGQEVCRLREKPTVSFFVNAGIYLLEPVVHRLIPNGEHLDMTDLIDRLLQMGKKVVSFPVVEYWLDIGEHSDYQRAQDDVKNGKIKL